jgi:hypothetical protein
MNSTWTEEAGWFRALLAQKVALILRHPPQKKTLCVGATLFGFFSKLDPAQHRFAAASMAGEEGKQVRVRAVES